MIFFNEGNRQSMSINNCHFTVGIFYWNNTEKLKSTLFDPRVLADNGNTRSWPPLITNFYRKVCKFYPSVMYGTQEITVDCGQWCLDFISGIETFLKVGMTPDQAIVSMSKLTESYSYLGTITSFKGSNL
jgi:hypothetical protein